MGPLLGKIAWAFFLMASQSGQSRPGVFRAFWQIRTPGRLVSCIPIQLRGRDKQTFGKVVPSKTWSTGIMKCTRLEFAPAERDILDLFLPQRGTEKEKQAIRAR